MSAASLRSPLVPAVVMLLLSVQVLAADESDKRPVAGYIPNLYAAIIFAAVFGMLSVMSWIHFARRRLIFILPVGLTAMTIGLGIRAYCHFKPYSIPIYSGSMLLVLLSPCAFLACCYQLLGKMANTLGRDTVAVNCLPLRTMLITKIFVASDIVTFLVQAGGSGLQASGGNISKYGHWIALVGLIVQLVSFAGYCILLVFFGFRVRSMYPELWRHNDGNFSWSLGAIFSRHDVDKWKVVFWSTIWACIALMVRCAFRVVEYSQGYDGAIATNEIWAYLLDSLTLFIGMGVYVWFWPAKYLSDAHLSSGGTHKLVPLYSQA